MMNSARLAVMGCLLLQLGSTPAHALVKWGPESKSDIKEVKLLDTVSVSEGSPALKRVTQGLRQKKVVFAWFSVYVAQIFSNGAKIEFDTVAHLKSSLKESLPVVVSMTFLRDVGIDKIVEGFSEGFKENKVDLNEAPVRDFLNAIQKSGDINNHQVISFIFNQNGAQVSFTVETKGSEIFALKNQTLASIEPFFNIWLGAPSDSGLEKLQAQFLKP